MLNVFTMLGDKCRSEFVKLHSQLREDLRPYKILHRLLGARIGIDVNFKLDENVKSAGLCRQGSNEAGQGGHTTYSSSSVSCATSGTVMLPFTVSALDVVPALIVNFPFGTPEMGKTAHLSTQA